MILLLFKLSHFLLRSCGFKYQASETLRCRKSSIERDREIVKWPKCEDNIDSECSCFYTSTFEQ